MASSCSAQSGFTLRYIRRVLALTYTGLTDSCTYYGSFDAQKWLQNWHIGCVYQLHAYRQGINWSLLSNIAQKPHYVRRLSFTRLRRYHRQGEFFYTKSNLDSLYSQ